MRRERADVLTDARKVTLFHHRHYGYSGHCAAFWVFYPCAAVYRVIYLHAAAYRVFLMLMWAFVMPRSVIQRSERMKTLRRQIETRYGGLSPQS